MFFTFSEPNYVDSSSILFKDDQFEDVSKVRKSFCWKYCLLDKVNDKAKCKVKTSEGKYCDKFISVKGGTKGIIEHLKRRHGMIPEPCIFSNNEKNAENVYDPITAKKLIKRE